MFDEAQRSMERQPYGTATVVVFDGELSVPDESTLVT